MDSNVTAVIRQMEQVLAQCDGAKAGRAAWDRLRLVEILEDYYRSCAAKNRMDDFAFAFAAYCSMYIQKGFQAQLGNWDFSEFGSWFEVEGTQGEFFRCLWLGIRDQSDRWFEMALKRCPRSAVTALYLFARRAEVLSRELAAGGLEAQGEGEMWRYFELLPGDYREYALGAENSRSHRAADRNPEPTGRWLPYISFGPEPAQEVFAQSCSGLAPVYFDSRAARGLFLGRFHMFCEGRRLRRRLGLERV